MNGEHAVSATLVECSIESVIAERAVRTVFQPVVHLASRTVAGFEALSRGPAGTALELPMALIAAAKDAGLLAELDWLCRAQAMQAAADAGLPEQLSWLVNVEPVGLAIDCPAHLKPMIDRARADLRVILEIVERDVDGNVFDLIRATDQARLDAWGVALDDVGAEESSLALLPFLRPDVVKLDMSLVRAVPSGEAAAITAAVRSYAERKNAIILAEGIETAEQERLAVVFGATYGQGYYYGRPGPLPATVPAPPHPIPLRQHLTPLDGRTPYEVLSAKTLPQRGSAEDLIHIRTHLEQQAADGMHASVLLAGFHSHDYFTTATRARYDQLAKANALTVVLAAGLASQDESTYHIGPLREDSAMAQEWVIIVLGPHYAAAFALRERLSADEQSEATRPRQFDFVYTHDRPTVIDAARCFVQELARPVSFPTTVAAGAAVGDVNSSSSRPTQQRRARTAKPGSRTRARSHSVTADSPAPAPTVVPAAGVAQSGFRAASQVVLDYLNTNMPMGFWSITRVENDRQTYLYLDDNDFGLTVGGSHPWSESFCVHMVAGTAPRIAPDTASVPAYANAAVNDSVQIGAYAGAPIVEPDGTLFGAICGLDHVPRGDLSRFGPILDTLSEMLTVALATDRALHAAQQASYAALTQATTDALTGVSNRRAWDRAISQLDDDYVVYADPTVIAVIDLDNLKQINDGPGGHSAGDQLLRDAAAIMRRSIRDTDFLARIGGDEFGLILTNTPTVLAPKLAHRLNRALDRAGVPASIGWAPLQPHRTAHTATELADNAMLAAKRTRKTKGA